MLKRLTSSAYLLEFPDDVPTSPMFKITDLFPFYGDVLESVGMTSFPFAEEEQRTTKDSIEDVMNDRTF